VPLLQGARAITVQPTIIGSSEITVKVHRGQVMRKMNAASLPELARMAGKLVFTAEKSQSC
jgi:FixJ family two-component response regulator